LVRSAARPGAVAYSADVAAEVAVKAAEFVAAEAPIITACKADSLSLEELERLYMSR